MNVWVVGSFRSGTNLMKHLLERCFDVRCSFNGWGWKHALAPTLVAADAAGHLSPALPVIVMVKEPLQQNVSLFHHWSRTRPGLIAGRTFSQFVRAELLVHDNSFGGKGPKYLFPTPTDYWNQLNFSYLFWDDIEPRRQLVRLESLLADPRSVLTRLERAFSLTRRPGTEPAIPPQRVMPSADGSSAQLHGDERYSAGIEIDADDRAFITSRVSPIVLERIYAD